MQRLTKKSLTVILPTYNEAGNILRLIRAVKRETRKSGWQLTIQVVDDNSPDKTADLVKKAFASDSSVKLALRIRERGLATAILRGLKAARGEYILFMDADFNHHPKYIPAMLEMAERQPGTVINGSRYIRGGGMHQRERFIGSHLMNKCCQRIVGSSVTDFLGGYILVPQAILSSFPLQWIFRGFGEWALRLLYLLYEERIPVKEIPVFYPRRRHGKSKMKVIEYARTIANTLLELKLTSPQTRI